MKLFICHYGEIGLKGKNRRFFEKRLLSNIKESLKSTDVSAPRGRVIVNTEDEKAEEKLKKIPGIRYFSPASKTESNPDKIEEKLLSLIEKEKFSTFRITVKRADKSFGIPSMELASHLGEKVVKKTGKSVNLTDPDLECIVEIAGRETYIYFKKIKGVGGLPVGTGGKALSMLSGGIDSPVASFLMSKRGVKNIFVHFHAYPATSKNSIEKAERIVKKLSFFQGKSVLYLVPFNEIQKEIITKTQSALRVLLYRRMMMRISERLAEEEKAKIIITGESLGQVASQTMENMTVTEEALSIPIFRPLVGFDKEEIIRKAKNIETYEISILPDEDCCVRFLPKKPETRASIMPVKKEEEKLDMEKMIEEALQKTKRKIISP